MNISGAPINTHYNTMIPNMVRHSDRAHLTTRDLVVTTHNIRSRPHVNRNDRNLQNLDSLRGNLPPRLFAYNHPRRVIVALMHRRYSSNLLRDIISVPPLRGCIHRPRPHVNVILLHQQSPHRGRAPPNRLRDLVRVIRVRIRNSNRIVRFNRLNKLLNNTMRVTNHSTNDRHFLISIRGMRDSNLRLTHVTNRAIILLMLDRLPALANNLRLILKIPSYAMEVN